MLSSFLMPTRNAASGILSYSGNTARANVTAANCTLGSYSKCTATITGLAGQKSFSLRLNSMYQPSDITVEAYHGGTQLGISGAQAIVDVTGKANDVLRRIQVRVPVGVKSDSAEHSWRYRKPRHYQQHVQSPDLRYASGRRLGRALADIEHKLYSESLLLNRLRIVMKAFVDAFEMWVSDVSINLRSGNVAVAEHGLNAAQVGPIHKQIRSKRMTQCVRADVLGDTR
jgi:hypothetical protein